MKKRSPLAEQVLSDRQALQNSGESNKCSTQRVVSCILAALPRHEFHQEFQLPAASHQMNLESWKEKERFTLTQSPL